MIAPNNINQTLTARIAQINALNPIYKLAIGALIRGMIPTEGVFLKPRSISSFLKKLGEPGAALVESAKSELKDFIDFGQVREGVAVGDIPTFQLISTLKVMQDRDLAAFKILNSAALARIKQNEIIPNILATIKQKYISDNSPKDISEWANAKKLKVININTFKAFLKVRTVKSDMPKAESAIDIDYDTLRQKLDRNKRLHNFLKSLFLALPKLQAQFSLREAINSGAESLYSDLRIQSIKQLGLVRCVGVVRGKGQSNLWEMTTQGIAFCERYFKREDTNSELLG